MKQIIYTQNDLYDAMSAAEVKGQDLDFTRLFEDILIGVIDSYNNAIPGHQIDVVLETIDSSLIYEKDKRTMLRFYCSPYDANFDKAFDCLVDDIGKALGYLSNK